MSLHIRFRYVFLLLLLLHHHLPALIYVFSTWKFSAQFPFANEALSLFNCVFKRYFNSIHRKHKSISIFQREICIISTIYDATPCRMCASVSQLTQLILLFIACYDPILIEGTWIQLDEIMWSVWASEWVDVLEMVCVYLCMYHAWNIIKTSD